MKHFNKFNCLAAATVLAIGLSLMACSGAQAGPDETPEPTTEAKLPALIVDGDEGETIAFPLHPTRRLADPDSNIAGMSFFELQIAARSPGAPPHTHSHEDEFFYVRAGHVTFLSGDTTKTIGPGGLALLPRHGLHGFWNAGDTDAILLVGTSEGKFGDFFDAVAIAAREEGAKSPQEVGAILGRVSTERGIEIDMSKIPADVAALYGL